MLAEMAQLPHRFCTNSSGTRDRHSRFVLGSLVIWNLMKNDRAPAPSERQNED